MWGTHVSDTIFFILVCVCICLDRKDDDILKVLGFVFVLCCSTSLDIC